MPGPMQFGLVNDAGSDLTGLRSSNPGSTLLLQNIDTTGSGIGLSASGPSGARGRSLRPGGSQSGVVGQGFGDSNNGVVGEATSGFLPYGVWGIGGSSQFAKAGHFSGNVSVTGTLFKPGGGFRIDDPRAPESRYLNHSFVESADMLNVYTGNVTTDANSQAEVVLPDYFEHLNEDFRYQLTVVGQFAQAVVSDEIRDNRFTISTDQPNVKVSWQVTGIRRDPWANRNRIAVEEDKPDHERGTYLHPEVYGKPETASADHARLEALRASLPEAEVPNGQTPSAQ